MFIFANKQELYSNSCSRHIPPNEFYCGPDKSSEYITSNSFLQIGHGHLILKLPNLEVCPLVFLGI